MRSPIGCCLLLGALLLSREGFGQRPEGMPQAALTTTEAVQKLSGEEARRPLPVQVRGVVSFVHEPWRLLFVEDSTGGIFCESILVPILPALGHQVEIRGQTAEGTFLSYLRAAEIRDLGPGALPDPRPAAASSLWSGQFDGDFVRVSGYVAEATALTNPTPMLRLRLTSTGPDVNVQVLLNTPGPSAADLPGSYVRADGVFAPRAVQGQLQEVIILSARTSMLQVLTNASEVLSGLAATPIRTLLADTNAAGAGLLRVRGVVNLAGKDEFWLGEQGSGINVWAPSGPPVRRGEQIELVGFLRVWRSERTLGLTRIIARANSQPGAPVRVSVKDLFDPARYGQVVQVDGAFLHRVPDRPGDVLVMREGEQNFEARILYPSGRELRALEGGSRLRVSGVLRWLPSDDGGLSVPRLLVAEPAGLEKLTAAPWPLRRTLTVVAALAIGLAGGLVALASAYARLNESNRRVAAGEREVRELNAELEDRIQRRTAELKASNDSLSAEVEERRKALERERALRESEERYRTFLGLSTEGFSRWEEEEPIPTALPEEQQVDLIFERSRLVECNDAFAQMYGFARAQDAVGARLPDLFSRSDSRNVELVRHYVRNGYRLKDAESVERGPAGSPRLFLNNLVGIVEQGRLVSGWNTQRDITARKQTEDSLRTSEQRLSAVVEAIAEMVWVGEPGKIQPSYVSSAFVKIWGRPIQYLFDSPTAALETIHPDDRARFLYTIERQAAGERTAAEYRILRPDGSVRWIWDQGFPVRDTRGRVVMINGIASDITERRTAEEARRSLETRLRHAQKMEAIGTLAGGLAHEFNNILGSIVGHTELARLDCADRPAVVESLECVLQASSRAQARIHQILVFSHQHRGELKPIHVADAVTDAIQLVRATVPAAIEIQPKLSAGEATVLAEPTQIHQIVINLATNAVQAMQEGGVLRIGLERVEVDAERVRTLLELKVGSYVRLSVIDTGHGMSSATLERMFEPFFTTKAPGEGTGLGLAVVHGIVQALQGVIMAESRPGEGSRFDVYLPAQPGPNPHEPFPGPEPARLG